MPPVVGTVVGSGPVCSPAMALVTSLLFLSSVSAQTIYDIVSPRFTSTSLKCRSSQTLAVRCSGKRLGTATSCSQGFCFFVLYSVIVSLNAS